MQLQLPPVCWEGGCPSPSYLGAEDSLLDEEVAVQVGCSLEPLATPITATALDVRIIAGHPGGSQVIAHSYSTSKDSTGSGFSCTSATLR